jgi:hypothetical protein
VAAHSTISAGARALEVPLAADDFKGEFAELYGYVNRAFPDAQLNSG